MTELDRSFDEQKTQLHLEISNSPLTEERQKFFQSVGRDVIRLTRDDAVEKYKIWEQCHKGLQTFISTILRDKLDFSTRYDWDLDAEALQIENTDDPHKKLQHECVYHAIEKMFKGIKVSGDQLEDREVVEQSGLTSVSILPTLDDEVAEDERKILRAGDTDSYYAHETENMASYSGDIDECIVDIPVSDLKSEMEKDARDLEPNIYDVKRQLIEEAENLENNITINILERRRSKSQH